MKKIILILLLIDFCVTSSIAQEVWSLEYCISAAKNQNLQLHGVKLDVESSEENHYQAIRELLPSVNGAIDYGISYGRAVNPNSNDITNTNFFSNNYSVTAELNLFNGFQQQNTIKSTALLKRANLELAKQQEFLLQFQVMNAFYNVIFLQKQVIQVSLQLKGTEESLNLIKKQITLGMKATADQYEAEAVLSGDQLRLSQSKNQLAIAKLTLLQIMNEEHKRNFNLEEPSEIEFEGKLYQEDSLYAKVQKELPLLKSQKYRVLAAKKEIAINRAGLLPQLSAFAAYGTGFYETIVDDEFGKTVPFQTQWNDNASTYIGLSLSIPISNRWSNRSRIKQSRITYERTINQQRIQEQLVRQTLEQLVQENRAFQIEERQSALQLKAQESRLKIAEKKYKKGLIGSVELFQAKNDFVLAQNMALQIKMKLKVNESTLNLYDQFTAR